MSIRYPQYPEGTVSVTEVLKASGLMGWLPEDQYFLDRGSYTHEAIALYLKGKLDESTLSEGIKPFVDSAIEWIIATSYIPSFIELSLHDELYGFCGTPDTVPIIDWKNSGKSAWQSVQISAYYHLCKVNGIILGHKPPMSVHLSDKGKMAKCQPYTIAEINANLKLFFSALHVFQWRKNNGLIKEKP